MAAVSVVFGTVTSGVYANATVWAGDAGARGDCGTVWEPNAVTNVCATALTRRSWVVATLLGLAWFGALGAVVVAGRSPRRGRHLTALAVTIAAVVIVGGLVWGGVIDRTFGS
jgi:CHASE2 domain-containing sensor protein